jgi:Tol biopolymer transport system component/DNA-binding SARP family transcriptional activator
MSELHAPISLARVHSPSSNRLAPVNRPTGCENPPRNHDMRMIELRMLGAIQLRADNPDSVAVDALLRQSKRLALLMYLASPMPGTWHRRDMLLALFWPEHDVAHARTSLRNALHVLRRTLGDDIVRARGDEEVSLDPELVRTDVAEVWAALRDGRAEDALAHYGGELLPGLYPPSADGFMRWLDSERSRLKTGITSAATMRVDEFDRDGDMGAALAVARRVLEINPDDETIVRRVMSLHEVIGDRAGALATFENYRTRLAAEFDAEPAPETVALATRLREPTLSRTIVTTQAPSHTFAPPRMAVPVAAPKGPPTSTTTDGRPRSAFKSRLLLTSGVVALSLATMAVLAWNALRPPRPLAIGASAPITADEGLQIEPAISPDGRLVAFAKGNARLLQIYVQRIGEGQPWRLTSDSTATEIMPRWAPDKDQILFLARNNAYVAPAIGGSARVVARGAPGDGRIRSASWSPGGDSIAIVRNDSLITQPLGGNGSRVVGVARGRQLHSCVWSPRGTSIACAAGNWVAFEPGPLFGNEAPSAVVLFPSAGGDLVEVTGSETQNKSPAWSPDGGFLWLLSNRDGTPGEVYAAPIGHDGRPSGEFVRVGMTAESIALAANRIAYSLPVRRANVWSAPVPRDSVLTLAAATPITSGTQLIELLNVSGDKIWLVYDSNVYGNADIFRMPIGGGSSERLTDDPRPEYGGVLSPDGAELVWQRWVGGVRRLFSRRLGGDSAREISFGPGDQGVPHWSPDGRSLVAWSHATEEGAVFVMHRDARGVWQPPAWRLQGGRLPGWSADGGSIAFILPDGGIATIPADSGAPRTIYRPHADTRDPIANQLLWNLDSSTVWFIGGDSHGRTGIWSVPARGGAARLRVELDDPSGRAHGPGFATDGSRFYFTLDERFSNLRWAELVRR